jgi:hypothetical protein
MLIRLIAARVMPEAGLENTSTGAAIETAPADGDI